MSGLRIKTPDAEPKRDLIIAFDIGIKNFAYCVMNIQDNRVPEIIYWGLLPLVEDNVNCNSVSVGAICETLYRLLPNLNEYLPRTRHILFEHQPCLKNPKMKTIQIAAWSFFLYKKTFNASHQYTLNFYIAKLKFNCNEAKLLDLPKPTTSPERKKYAVALTELILKTNGRGEDIDFLRGHPKKDDLCDAFLMCFQFWQSKYFRYL